MKRRTAKLKAKHAQCAKPASRVSVVPFPWDMGASGPANRVDLELEDAPTIDPDTGEARNPNNVRRARRIDMIERWYRTGQITSRGFTAGQALRIAFEATMRAPGMPQSERVDSSPKPDHAIDILIDRISKYHAVMRHVSPDDKALISACVLGDSIPARVNPAWKGRRHREGIAALSDALDRVATAMGS